MFTVITIIALAATPDYLVELGGGVDTVTSDSARWIGESQGSARVGVRRELFTFIGDLWLTGGLNVRPGATELDTTITTLNLGAAFELHLGRYFYPYARVALEGLWIDVRAGDRLAGDAFTTGALGGAGIALRPAKGGLFVYAEGTYSRRVPVDVKLTHDDKEEIGGPGTRIGALDASGWTARAGAGLAF